MRSMPTLTLLGFMGSAAVLAQVGDARAQMTMPTGGTCSGSIGTAMVSGTVSMALVQKDGTPLTLPSSTTVFGRAECECRSRDLAMLFLMTTPLPRGLEGSTAASAWVGAVDCTSTTTRTQNNTQCQQLSESSPPGSKTVINTSNFTSSGLFPISLPSEALTNPKPVGTTSWDYACDPAYQTVPPTSLSGTLSRTAYVFLGDINNSPVTCQLPLSVKLDPPQAPTLKSLTGGDGALTVSWSIPEGTSGIEYYQVLCRKKGIAVPVMSQDFINDKKFWFSSCINGQLYRRPLLPGIMDNTIPDPSVGTQPLPRVDMGTDDGGTADGGTADGGTADLGTAAAPPFVVDGRFICSDKVGATATDLSARVDGLENGSEYEVMVVSIDPSGNPAPSAIAVGVPQPTQSPLGPFCKDGVCPGGFGCQAAAGPLSVGALAMMAAGSGLLLMRRGRRRRLAQAAPGRGK